MPVCCSTSLHNYDRRMEMRVFAQDNGPPYFFQIYDVDKFVSILSCYHLDHFYPIGIRRLIPSTKKVWGPNLSNFGQHVQLHSIKVNVDLILAQHAPYSRAILELTCIIAGHLFAMKLRCNFANTRTRANEDINIYSAALRRAQTASSPWRVTRLRAPSCG